jgi:hypothetical protein
LEWTGLRVKKLKKNKIITRYLLIEFDIINLLFSISLNKRNSEQFALLFYLS